MFLSTSKTICKVADDMRRMTTSKQSKDSLLDNFQFALDMLGMLPGIGEVTDILSGALYGARNVERYAFIIHITYAWCRSNYREITFGKKTVS